MRFTETPSAFLSDFGSTVVWGAVSGLGVLDMPDQVVGGISISTGYTLTVETQAFEDLVAGDSLTVDGVAYTVREFHKIDDGTFARVSLSKT